MTSLRLYTHLFRSYLDLLTSDVANALLIRLKVNWQYSDAAQNTGEVADAGIPATRTSPIIFYLHVHFVFSFWLHDKFLLKQQFHRPAISHQCSHRVLFVLFVCN